MTSENKLHNRKQFIGLGISLAAFVTVFKFWPKSKTKKKKSHTVTMLAQDGQLVQVDISALPSKKEKITNKELQGWISKK